MTECDVTLNCSHLGLHWRLAAEVVMLASTFDDCQVRLEAGDRSVDARSIMALAGAGFQDGQQVRLVVDGKDEEIASVLLKTCLENLDLIAELHAMGGAPKENIRDGRRKLFDEMKKATSEFDAATRTTYLDRIEDSFGLSPT